MLKKTITYTDYNGQTQTKDFYFNLNKAELIELEVSERQGYAEMLQEIAASNDGKAMMQHMKSIIKKAYGVKSEDGQRFIKSEELSEEFLQTEAFSELFYELGTKAQATAAFVNGLMPQGLVQELASKQAAQRPPLHAVGVPPITPPVPRDQETPGNSFGLPSVVEDSQQNTPAPVHRPPHESGPGYQITNWPDAQD